MSTHEPASRTGRNELPLVAAPRLVPAAGYRATLRSILVGPSVAPRTMHSPKILVLDSGVGGLTVFREIVHARPDAQFVYLMDDALFPYGKAPEGELIEHIVAVMDDFVAAHQPDLAVIACNTASTLVLPALRQRFTLPFVGTVPAIKPACAASQSKRISVLGTEATVAREYTHALIRSFGQGCDVTLVGSGGLAPLAEAVKPSAMRRSAPRSRLASSGMAANAPIRWCSPARTIRCCSTASKRLRPGRCAGSIRRRRSRGVSSSWSARRPAAIRSNRAPPTSPPGALPLVTSRPRSSASD